MEVALVSVVAGAVVKNLVAKLSAAIATRSSELGNFVEKVKSLKTELLLISCKVDEALKKERPSSLQLVYTSEMRDLAFEIEDCLDQFLPCASCGGGAVSLGDAVAFAARIKKLKKRLEDTKRLIQEYKADVAEQATESASRSVASTYRPADDPVGMDKPKLEILGFLSSQNLKVVAIVGFGGSVKTELATAVYNCPDVDKEFGLRAWLTALDHNDGDSLLVAILKKLLPAEPLDVTPIPSNQFSRLQEQIITHLQATNTRCLIVIDDMIECNQWGPIKTFFFKLKIKILLTTTLQPVANTCTGDNGYIYNMRSLNDVDSKTLLVNMVPKLQEVSPDLKAGSDAIVHNCHGHPLALTSIANYLLTQEQGRLKGTNCEKASRLLCRHTDNNTLGIFRELRQVLVNSCTDLSVDLKTCLLYTSLFPNGHPVSSKTLTGRWLAEGYIGDESDTKRSPQAVADENLKVLMDRNIIRPTDAMSSGDAKTCKPHGVMHQFMLYKSISSNFIATTLKDRRHSRHLVIENYTSGRDHSTVPVPVVRKNLKKKIASWFKFKTSSTSENELRPRSVAVFGSAEEAVYSDLLKCKLLRVLDLKECRDSLGEHHRDNICKLLHLKYLTLGSSFGDLSVEMKKLHCLETLDLRKTKIEELPEEVISLPHLAHLFGKIKLQHVHGDNFVKKFKEGTSNMQTLAGVVVDNQSVFPRLMDHMKKLRKITIWCEITSTDSNTYTLLSHAIHKYFEGRLDTPDEHRSLSLHLNYSSKDLLCRPVSRQEGGVLTALKLQLLGKPNNFKEFIESLTFLQELCLTSTDLERGDLQALCTLQRLVCLKLVQDCCVCVEYLYAGVT